jgi:hypothetical protein
LLWGPCPEGAAQVSDVIGCIINPRLRILYGIKARLHRASFIAYGFGTSKLGDDS